MKALNIGLKDLKTAALSLAPKLKGGEILALIGPLGAGKTSFTKALGKTLKIKSHITSPTFTLMTVHQAVLKNRRKVYFYHLDLYRTKSFKEVKTLGITEIWGKPNVITVIEWANKINRHLPASSLKIHFFAPKLYKAR